MLKRSTFHNSLLMKRFLLLIIWVLCLSVPVLHAQYTGVPSSTYADSLFRTGIHDQALQAYNRLLQEEPENYEFRFRHALLLGWTGNYMEAESALSILYDENPNDWDAAAALIRVIAWQDRTVDALRLTEAVLERNPDNLELRSLQVQMVFWYGNLRRADQLARRLAEDAPDDPNVLTIQQAVNDWMSTESLSRYTYVWDSENIGTHILTQSVHIGVLPGTAVTGRSDYVNSRNTFTSQQAQSVSFSLGARQQFNRNWSAIGALSTVYVPDSPVRLSPSGAVIFRTMHTNYSVGASRILLTDTPALISNAIYQTDVEGNANFSINDHEIGLRANHGWLSDDNKRIFIAGSYQYGFRFAELTYTPGISGAYRSFEKSGINNGYFAPEWHFWFALAQTLRWEFRQEFIFLQLSGDIGMQQFQLHNTQADDPALKYETALVFGYRPFENIASELAYRYTNLVGVSTQSNVADFWGQSLQFTIRAAF